jgi:hypothetical protein
MSTKYWIGSQWVSADGSTTTAPGIGDVGILGGILSGITLPQSGAVPFFGQATTEVGTLMVEGGSDPWTIEGTGGTGSKIDSLIVAMGSSVTVNSQLAVKSVSIQEVPGVTAPAIVNLNNGLAAGDTIDFQNQPGLVYTSAFDGTNTNITVSSDGVVVGEIALTGNAQLGPPTSDGKGGTSIIALGTQPYIGTPFSILTVSSANDIGRASGEYVQVGDNVVLPNAYQGTTGAATSITDPSTGQPYSQISVVFSGSAAIPNQFDRKVASVYDPSNPADNYMIQPWNLTFTNGTSSSTTTTPSLVGVPPPPLASNVTVSGNSTNPTFTWYYPSGSIDGVFFDIFDDSILANGQADLVYTSTIPGNTGTFTLPSLLDGGLTLQQNHHYTLDLYGVASRDPTQPLSNANSAAWSESYFDLESITGGTVPTVYLPTITSVGAYMFNISVIAGQTYFVDPAVATGYTYTTGAGNPNFASVELPAIQTAPYTVSFLNNGVQETDTVAPSTVLTFPSGGVGTFTVTGIDPADNLDPANATAFVTGLTFVSSGSFTGTQTPIVETICYCRGTLILTNQGEIAVEALKVGDQVRLFGGGTAPIIWIGEGRIPTTRGRRTAATPVIVRKGALADNVPNRDLRITKAHGLYLDGALIPVEFLVNHRSILWDDSAQEAWIYHIELETHDVLIANGAPAESYRDDGNRWLFQNANTGWHLPPKPACAPVVTGGPLVDAVWRRLLDRSGPRAGLPLTDDTDLHLLVNGGRVEAARPAAGVYVFGLSGPPYTVRIISRAAIPQELGLARDPRCLGVAIQRIVVRQGTRFRTLLAADALLARGFHTFEVEQGFRWTSGDAVLPNEAFAGFTGPLEIVLTVARTARYPYEGDRLMVA